jgi:very-short-patch-repair endonuclease
MPPRRTTPKGYENARQLRHELTPAERKLWATLRGDQLNGASFRRQHAIGPYIADFCSIKAKLIIELDGSQHLEQEEYDAERTKYLEAQGYTVIRFWNNEVLNNLDGVILAITYALEENT